MAAGNILPDTSLTEEEEKMAIKDGKSMAVRAGLGVLIYPVTHVRILAQLGHEPFPLKKQKLFWTCGPERYWLPNFLSYGKHIYNERGVSVLYTGVWSNLASTVFGALGSFYAKLYLDRNAPNFGGIMKNEKKKERELTDSESFQRYIRTAMRETAVKVCGTIVSRPFQVIMIRQIAGALADDSRYGGILTSIRTINNEQGVAGFFAGLAPAIVVEAVTIWAVQMGLFMFERVFVAVQGEMDEGVEEETDKEGMSVLDSCHTVFKTLWPLVVGSYLYPYNLCATVMAVNDSGVPYAGHFGGWQDCWEHLKRYHELKRGSGGLFRQHKGAISVGIDSQCYVATKKFI